MKILFVGYRNSRFISLCEYIENAIVESGHELEYFDYRSWSIPGRIREKINILHEWDQRRINQRLIDVVEKFQPDILIATGAWTIKPETIDYIKGKFGVKTVNWIADFPLMFDTYLEVGPHYDYFFTSGTEALERYKASGAKNGHWLPFACDENEHTVVELSDADRKKYSADICFVGSKYEERIEVLESLTDYNLGIWGPGWEQLPDNSPLKKCVRGSVVTGDEWKKIYAASKIVLNIIGHRCDVTTPWVEAKEFKMTNTKVFEILAMESFQLVDEKKDAQTLFENKKHLVFYKDNADLKKKVEQYLNNDQARLQIAKQGCREVRNNHTYGHRLIKILEMLNG